MPLAASACRGVLSLWASSLGHSGALWGQGRKRKESLQPCLWNLNFASKFPCGTTSTELSDFHQSAQSGNKCECKQTLKTMWKMELTSFLMSSPPTSISHPFFRCRYSNSRDVVASSRSFSHPTARAPRCRACSQAGGFFIPPGPSCLKAD